MTPHTQRSTLPGPAGDIAVAVDMPAETAESVCGTVVVCHPHPQQGGTMDNKVVTTVARAFVQCGWRAVRFNFRGVGGSAGAWDGGVGEVDDALAVLAAQGEDTPLALAGFSFGAYVAASAAARLGRPLAAPLMLVGPATRNFATPPVPETTLVIHGEHDDVVPLAATLDWARPQGLPITVVPGCGHFFHGQLPLLKQWVKRGLAAHKGLTA